MTYRLEQEYNKKVIKQVTKKTTRFNALSKRVVSLGSLGSLDEYGVLPVREYERRDLYFAFLGESRGRLSIQSRGWWKGKGPAR
jgi:hypothetical protein